MVLNRTRIVGTSFFQRDPLLCARELVGMQLMWGKCAGIIVETEAYLTENDKACHTFNRQSARDFVQRNKAGAVYIYLNYGMHWMLNVLVKGAPRTGLILIRALEPTHGLALMSKRRGVDNPKQLCSGPGKLTQALAINIRHHEIDLCADPRHGFLESENDALDIDVDRRIGITRAADLPWRFTLRGSEFVSQPLKL